MERVVLLFGSNAADAADVVSHAAEIVRHSIGEIEQLSREYRSAAYGFSSDLEFVNRAAVVSTTLGAYELLRRINLIEALLGRDRDEERAVCESRGERYASRPIDIDIIFYADQTFNDQQLVIPYHYLYEREYALRPVAEVAGGWHHPALDTTPQEALRLLDSGKKE